MEKTSGIPFHGPGMADSSKTSANMSEKEKRDLWIKDLSDDPYTDEAMAVLSDMLAEQSATMTAERKRVSLRRWPIEPGRRGGASICLAIR